MSTETTPEEDSSASSYITAAGDSLASAGNTVADVSVAAASSVASASSSAASVVAEASTSAASTVAGVFSSLWASPAPSGPPPLKSEPKPLPTDPSALRKQLSEPGVLLLPSDGVPFLEARYDRAWNYDVLGSPSAIALPKTEGDVVQLVKYASQNSVKGLRLGVTCGHHSHYSCMDNSLMIDLRNFDSIDLDVESKTVKVGGGCLLGRVDEACEPHGLGSTFGHDPSTGVGGLTLQGGAGFLQRVYGLAVDNLLGARVVLASGLVVNTNEKEHPDLFWALRGAGTNYGVVLSFTFQLHQLPNNGMLMGGARVHMPIWPMPNRAALLDHFHETTANAPDEFMSIMAFPSMPVIQVCLWVGELDDGARHFEKNIWPVGWPVVDQTKTKTGTQYHSVIQRLVQGPDQKNVAPRHYFMKGLLLEDLSPAFKKQLLEIHAAGLPHDSELILLLLGGKSSRVPMESTSVASRAAKYWLLIQGSWGKKDPLNASPQAREECVQWARKAYEALAPHAGSIATYGVLPAMEGRDDAAIDNDQDNSMWGPHLPRLRAIKKKYDPRNVFKGNLNILPAK